MAKKLSPKQQRFVEEYLIDLNASQAAVRSGYQGDPNTIGPRLLANVGVSAAIAEAMKARSERTEITADKVLQRWWELANVDVNELVEFRRDNCRYCWGEGHHYQWTEGEFEQAQREAVEKGEPAPENLGGFGFIATREPNPECPECAGEGRGKIHVHDTRRLKGAARRLYRGVQSGKDGLKVLMADQDKALENVARHLGMFTDRVEHTGKNGGPIQTESTVRQDLSKLTDEQLAQLKQLAMAARAGGD
jgi:hypothetical protein